jgi:hypothetical protein
MTTSPVKSIVDEQVEEATARVRGTFSFPPGMRVADLPFPMKADWLKRRPIARPKPCP